MAPVQLPSNVTACSVPLVVLQPALHLDEERLISSESASEDKARKHGGDDGAGVAGPPDEALVEPGLG